MKNLYKKILFSLSILLSVPAFNQTWSGVASLPAGADVRHHPITFSIGGIGYLVAGATPSGGVLKDFYSYDVDSDSWSNLTDFPGPGRGYAYGVASDTKGYIGFGYNYNEETFEETVLGDLWEFDPVTGDWTELAMFPGAARYHPAMIYLNNKIYVGLGANNFGDLKDWWEYDILTNTWTEKTELPASERHHPYYFAIGEYAYAGFGHHGSEIFNDFYRYDPLTDSWEEMASLPDQGRVAGTQFSYADKGYILSGQGETHSNLSTGEFWEYNPISDAWVELTPHSGEGRWAPGSFVIGSKIFITCGQANDGERKDMMVFDFDPSSGLSQIEISNGIVVFPNPAIDEIMLLGDLNSFTRAELIDATGKVCYATEKLNNHIDISNLPSGIFILRLFGDESIVTKKVIVN